MFFVLPLPLPKSLILKGGAKGTRGTSKEGERDINISPTGHPLSPPLEAVGFALSRSQRTQPNERIRKRSHDPLPDGPAGVCSAVSALYCSYSIGF